MSRKFWVVKQEPEAYSWTDFVKDGHAAWTGVRNYQARNNLRAMTRGDHVFFYHSATDKAVVGVARVDRQAYPDPTATEGDWSCVDLVPVKGLVKPVPLSVIKADAVLREIHLVKNSRLSVSPLTQPQFERMLKLGETRV